MQTQETTRINRGVKRSADERRAQILTAALELARDGQYLTMTRDAIARQAKVSTGLVGRYFADMPDLRRAVMTEAIRVELLTVVAVGVATGDQVALSAPAELRAQAVARLGGDL